LQERTIEIYTDGAARGNPGDAAWAFVFVEEGRVIAQESGFLGTTTNNVAEYQAVIHAMAAALRRGHRAAALYSDSELVVRQIRGEYQVRKAHLRPLYEQVRTLAKDFTTLTFRAVPRSNPCIALADRLCNDTLDAHERGKAKI
jgi:ribonuclease HI